MSTFNDTMRQTVYSSIETGLKADWSNLEQIYLRKNEATPSFMINDLLKGLNQPHKGPYNLIVRTEKTDDANKGLNNQETADSSKQENTG